MIRFAHNIVINNGVYKACIAIAILNFQHNVAVFTVNFAKVHITGCFTKVNAAVSISVSCVVSCIFINTIMNVAVNQQPAIRSADSTCIRLQGNAIAFYSITIRTSITVQQITLGGNVYTAITGAYVININHIVCVSSNSLNVNIAAVRYSIKV